MLNKKNKNKKTTYYKLPSIYYSLLYYIIQHLYTIFNNINLVLTLKERKTFFTVFNKK